jgi:hypothetical protein
MVHPSGSSRSWVSLPLFFKTKVSAINLDMFWTTHAIVQKHALVSCGSLARHDERFVSTISNGDLCDWLLVGLHSTDVVVLRDLRDDNVAGYGIRRRVASPGAGHGRSAVWADRC